MVRGHYRILSWSQQLRVVPNRRRRAVQRDASAIEHIDIAGHPERPPQVLLDNHHGHAADELPSVAR